MASEKAMALLKADLGYIGMLPDEIRTKLDHDLDASAERIKAYGIELDEERADHMSLLVMHAAWLYRKRATGEGKPRMLVDTIHDIQTAQVTGRSRR